MKVVNIQPVEKQDLNNPKLLDVHSIFSTIQGEGPFAGQRAIFVRLAGCNLACPLCDTDYTNGRKRMTIEEICESVAQFAKPDTEYLVVITGGEPFRQDLSVLVDALSFYDYTIQIETNGTLYQPDLDYDAITIVCSPKAGKIHPKLLKHIAAYKYVLHADQVAGDGLPIVALDHTAKPHVARPHGNFDGTIYLQPVDVKDESENRRHLEAVKKSVIEHGYTLGLQLHKLINVE